MTGFIVGEEDRLCDEFLSKGIVKIPVEDREALEALRLPLLSKTQVQYTSLDTVHTSIFPPPDASYINDFRLSCIDLLKQNTRLRYDYYSVARSALHALVGNELAMQRNINLSIQFPGDDSSLLPVHADTWSGDSPYEVVLWVPLVDCYDTKSMYFCDKNISEEIDISQFKNSEDLFRAIAPHVTFMDVKYGECLIFSQNIMHGNRVNETDATRWSLNCRFKSLLSPYADKKLGEFFEPITIRPATRLGMDYVYPKV